MPPRGETCPSYRSSKSILHTYSAMLSGSVGHPSVGCWATRGSDTRFTRANNNNNNNNSSSSNFITNNNSSNNHRHNNSSNSNNNKNKNINNNKNNNA